MTPQLIAKPIARPRPPAELSAAVDALLIVLDEFRAHLGGLLELSGRKLASLRAADAAELQRCAAEEGRALEALAACDARRAAALAGLAQVLPAAADCGANLTRLAGVLPEPFSSRITAKSAGIRPIAEQLRQKNQLAARVARGLQSHLRAVFADVAHAHDQTVGYGSRGQLATHRTRDWVDAVG
jgi:hypothetical protein